MTLDGKVAIVTGAGSGIGQGTAQVFARRGASVVAADIDAGRGAAAVDQLKSEGHEAHFVKTDLTRIAECEHLVQEAVARYGKLDALVNVAGVTPDPPDTVVDFAEPAWDKIQNINLKSVFLTCKFAVPHMIKARSGSIVNVSSTAGFYGRQGGASYCSSKSGVLALTRNIALDYGKHGIRVNCIIPSFADTPMMKRFLDAQPDGGKAMELAFKASIPLGRFATATELGAAAAFLCSDEASFITGLPMLVDGGFFTPYALD